MPLKDFVMKQAEMAKERLEPLRQRLEKMRDARRPKVVEPRYAMPGSQGSYRIYEAAVTGKVVVDGLELPVATESGEISLAKHYRGQTYKYSGKGTRIRGYSAALPDLVYPLLDSGKDVLLVEYGDSYVIFTT